MEANLNLAKFKALEMIFLMDDNSSFEEIFYQLYVINKIETGLKEMHDGHCVSHNEAKEELEQWLS